MTIKWFNEISKEDIAIVGGKGANLGEMTTAGLPIPPGFVVTAQTFGEFIKVTGLKEKIFSKLANLDVENTELLQKTSEEIQQMINATSVPSNIAEEIIEAYPHVAVNRMSKAEDLVGGKEEFVAVRSSATAEDLPSIGEDCYVLVKVNGKPVYDSIKNIYQKYGDGSNAVIEVAAMENNKVIWSRAEQIYMHPANDKKLYQIITETGREVVITANHSLIILDDETFTPVTTTISKLKGGEMVPTTRKVPLLNLGISEIEVRDYVKGNDVHVENGLIYIKNKSSNWKIQNPLKLKLRLDTEFAYFLGVYCAEGCCYKDNGVIITNSDPRIMKRVEKFLESISLYNHQKINKHSLRVYCKALVRLLNETTGKPLNIKGKGKSCKIKKVPDFIFGGSNEIISSFLAGCFDGDGHISNSIEYCSTSKILIGGIVKLLEMLGIEAYIRRKGNSMTINVPASQASRFAEKIHLINSKKSERISRIILNPHYQQKNSFLISDKFSALLKTKFDEKQKKEKVDIYICPCCATPVGKTSYYKKRLRFYCTKCKKSFYEKDVKKSSVLKIKNYDEKGRFTSFSIPWNKGFASGRVSQKEFKRLMDKNQLKNYSDIFNKDVLWDKIKEVKEINYNGMVYDFTIPEVENFAAGIGGIITHNTASFAGQQATYLNIRGAEDVVSAVRACWASLYTARAIYYRIKNNFPHEKVLIAVVVQKMVNSDKSGVMFTINPARNDASEIVIEGALGLGEAVVSGAVNPDLYLVDKETMKIKSIETKEQKIKIIKDPETGKTVEVKLTPDEEKRQVCNDKEILELARLGKKIEQHYNSPQDTEWAIENGDVYIVQARAVTTFKANVKAEEGKDESGAEVLVKGETASPGVASGPVKIVLDIKELNKIQKGDIMVTTMTTPDMVPAMQKAAAIVTDEGGLTCHAAIVSREMMIPCIVGSRDATKVLKDGMIVTVHATHGNVYSGELKNEHVEPIVHPAAEQEIITATQIKVIQDLPEMAERIAAKNVDGVGLVRIEIMIAIGGVHPAEYIRTGRKEDYIKLLMNGIGGIAKAFKGKPVWIRTSDIRTDEYRNLEGGDKEPHETDPMLGWHAIRRGLDETEILKAEFEAVKRLHDSGITNVGVMIPFVIRTREIREAKRIMREIGLEPREDVEFGVMIETPAACWIIDEICKEGIDFVSFGTNDLTQLTLGIDRNNERISKLFDEMHHAVLGEINMVVKTCKKYNVKTSICGQAGSRPEMAKFLVGIGIDSISVNPDAIDEIRRVVARTEKALLLDAERNR